MTADVTPIRVVRLVPETGQTAGSHSEQGTGRNAAADEATDAWGVAVVDTTDDPAQAAQQVTTGAADCVVAELAAPAAALAAVRAGAPEAPFLAVLPRDAATAARDLLADPLTDVVWADESLPGLLERRAAMLVAAGAVETLRREREQVEHALDSLTDLFYVIGADGRMARWNRRFNERWELTDAAIAEMWPWEFLVEDDWPAVQEAIGEVLTEGEAAVRVRAALPDGRTPMLELQGRRLTDADGRVLGLCGTGRDVSEQAAREAGLRSRNERLDEFAAVLSHDLRNPLSVAVGSLEIARAERDSPDLQRAADALARLDDLIGDILLTARQGRAVTDTVPVSLRTISQAAWESVATEGATLAVTTDLIVRADPTRLRRVLENLFRNAVEHGSTSPAPGDQDGVEHSSTDSRPKADDSVEHGSTGSRTGSGDATEHGTTADQDVTVTVAEFTDEAGSTVGFVVADDGPGITEADRDRVFDRGHSTGDGVGLGLAVVRSLAEAHGWRVTLGDGPGARFEFHDVDVVSPAA